MKNHEIFFANLFGFLYVKKKNVQVSDQKKKLFLCKIKSRTHHMYEGYCGKC